MLWTIVKLLLALPVFALLIVLCIPGLLLFGVYALVVWVLHLLGYGRTIDILIIDALYPRR